MNVTKKIVKQDFCIGCGICAGICPQKNLYLDWSDQGELVPFEKNSCKDQCSICLEICPFYDHILNQDNIADNLFSETQNINYNQYTGYYLTCYVGHIKDEHQRLKSASGGVATSLLSSLIKDKIVDEIVTVGHSQKTNRMFDFKILDNPEDLNSCAGSVYYPVELSRVLKKILTEKSKIYAVIALPCFIYGLRLASEKFPELKEKIKLMASLTCGQLQNKYCTELLALESGILVKNLVRMDFRRKSENNSASNFLQVAIDKKGNEGIPHRNNDLPHHLWHYKYFTHNACSFCDDIFGELADITFMDAWLPQYIKDYRGTSLIIVRNTKINELLRNSKEFNLEEINVSKVIESQEGVIFKKRELLRGRLFKAEKMNNWYPKKRVFPNLEIYNENKEFIELTYEIQNLSKKLWHKYRLYESCQQFWEYLKEMESKTRKHENSDKIKYILGKIKNYFSSKRFS